MVEVSMSGPFINLTGIERAYLRGAIKYAEIVDGLYVGLDDDIVYSYWSYLVDNTNVSVAEIKSAIISLKKLNSNWSRIFLFETTEHNTVRLNMTVFKYMVKKKDRHLSDISKSEDRQDKYFSTRRTICPETLIDMNGRYKRS